MSCSGGKHCTICIFTYTVYVVNDQEVLLDEEPLFLMTTPVEITIEAKWGGIFALFFEVPVEQPSGSS